MAARCIPARGRVRSLCAAAITAVRMLLIETRIAQLELQRATEIAMGGTAADVERLLNDLRSELRELEAK